MSSPSLARIASLLERWLPGRSHGRAPGEAAARTWGSDERYRRLVEASPDGIVVTRNGRVVFANDAMAKLMGLGAPSEAYGRPSLDFVDLDFHRMIEEGRTQVYHGVMNGPAEVRLRHVDGTSIPVELRVAALDDAEGRTFVNVVRDLTARKAAEAELRLRGMVLDQATDGVVVADAEGRIVYINRAFCGLVGRAPGELLGKPAGRVLDGGVEHDADTRGIRDALARGVSWSGRYSFTDERGVHHHDARCFVVRDDDGAVQSLVAVIRDTTREVELEQRHQEGLKLEAIGQLAGGVAHDVKNLLTVILGHVEQLALEQPDDASVREHARAIGEAAERSASMARQLLAFGGRQVLEPRVVDLNAVVRRSRELVERLLPEGIAFEVSSGSSLPPVRLDPAGLQQVLLDLVINARDAIGSRGRIRVATRLAPAAQGEAAMVELRVEDDGAGMDAATRARIFEPFFSTKAGGGVAGLGLSTAHGIVRNSAGEIHVDSEPGRGTTVRIRFPAVDARGAMEEEGAARELAPAAGEIVLVVEDDSSVRTLARRSLVAAGYQVLDAVDGLDAIELARAHAGEIDLIVSDVIMPRMDGVELVERLRRDRPGLRALLVSGYVPAPERESRLAALDAAFLEKPFRMADLVASVRDALDRRS